MAPHNRQGIQKLLQVDTFTRTGTAFSKIVEEEHLVDGPPQIWDAVQQVALVDDDIRRVLGSEIIGIHPLPAEWPEDTLPGGAAR